jgi:hypothetical protein
MRKRVLPESKAHRELLLLLQKKQTLYESKCREQPITKQST